MTGHKPTKTVFPFWIVTQRRERVSLPVTAADAPDRVAAFSTAALATTYMVSRGETNWELRFVSRPTFAQLVGEVQPFGSCGIYLDPISDGSGAEIDFDALGAWVA